MTPADYREGARPHLERIQSYSEAPRAFRERWDLRHFRFRPSSWLALALLLAPVAWAAWKFGDAQLALKGVLAVMALIAVLPLLRDLRRSQCLLCKEEPERINARKLSGEEEVITACHQCRVFKVEEVDSSPLPL